MKKKLLNSKWYRVIPIVGYLNGTTGGFGASYIFMSVSLFLSALITMWAIKEKGGQMKVLAPL